MKDILLEMRTLRIENTAFRTSVESKFESLQAEYTALRKELQDLKEDMVTKQAFVKLESRVASLEAGGLASAQVSWLQDQINRLDSGRKSLSFAGFGDSIGAPRSH